MHIVTIRSAAEGAEIVNVELANVSVRVGLCSRRGDVFETG